MKTLTVGQVRKAMKKHKYIMLRDHNGSKFAINCKIMNIGLNRIHENNEETEFVTWYPCGFHEYINYKIPFWR